MVVAGLVIMVLTIACILFGLGILVGKLCRATPGLFLLRCARRRSFGSLLCCPAMLLATSNQTGPTIPQPFPSHVWLLPVAPSDRGPPSHECLPTPSRHPSLPLPAVTIQLMVQLVCQTLGNLSIEGVRVQDVCIQLPISGMGEWHWRAERCRDAACKRVYQVSRAVQGCSLQAC